MIDTGISSAEILLPHNVDMTKWACIACDQFTSEIKYWNDLKEYVGDNKSVLNLVLPEIYLDGSEQKRIDDINKNIKAYLSDGVFKKLANGFILTVRKTAYVDRRIGLIAKLDLEKYDYSENSRSLIRATEGTIAERIPPRLKIREKADIEFPHIMVLFDDENKEITEKLYSNRQNYDKVYDFELNMNGGHVEGYYIPDSKEISESFAKLLDSDRLKKKYGKEDKFIFAVGDGNHSLATAKAHWENVKKTLTEKEKENHPARYALVELVNIYDDGIYFEPIYRYVSGIDKQDFINKLKNTDIKGFGLYDGEREYGFGKDSLPKAIGNIDSFLGDYIKSNGGTVDYVHGQKHLYSLVESRKDAVGIMFDKLDKKDLFKYVSNYGPFPRKTFSMGEGIEKRYYLEGRKITE